jgi:hypothetical protein
MTKATLLKTPVAASRTPTCKVGLKLADVDIIEVRAADPEEIALDHAHGSGGHH